MASGACRSGCECGCCYVHYVVCNAIQQYEPGFRPPACKGHPVQVFEHGGHTAASTVVALHEACLSLHVLHSVDVFSLWTDPIPSKHTPRLA